MVCFKRIYRKRFFIILFGTIFAQFLMKGECLSLDIQNEQQTFTFLEGPTSEIIFHVNNITDGISLYVFKDGQNKSSSCKLLLTQTSCVTHVRSCQCEDTSKEGRVEFIFQKQFRVQDSGVWVFEVWNTNISKHVKISVQGNTTDTSTKNTSETTKNSADKLPRRGDFVSIAIIVIAALIIVIAVSSIIAVLCGPRFLMRKVCRVFTKSRGLRQGQLPVSSAQSSQISVSRDRRPVDEDVSQQDSDDAQSSRDGSLKEDVAFVNQKHDETEADIIKETTTSSSSSSSSSSQQTVDTTPAPPPAPPPAPRPRLKPPSPPTLPLQQSPKAPKASVPPPPPPPKPTADEQPIPTEGQQQLLQVSKQSEKPSPPSLLGLDPPSSDSLPASAPPTPPLPPKTRESQPASPAASGRQRPQALKPLKSSTLLQPLLGLDPPAKESETAPSPPELPPKLLKPEQLSQEPPIGQSEGRLLQEQATTMKPVDLVSRVKALSPPIVPPRTQVNSPETQTTNKPAVEHKPHQVPLLPPRESTPVLPRRSPAPEPPLSIPTPPKPPPTPVAPFKPPPLPVSPPKASPPAPPPKPRGARVSPDCKEQWLPPQL